jgi:hypothetical protein
MKKNVLLLTWCLVGCQVPTDYVGPAYEANLPSKDLACCIVRDILHTPQAQPLQMGQNKPGDFATWGENNGALKMALSDAGSMGVFSTGLNLGRDKAFSVSATFQNPVVTDREIFKPWAIGVVARTGDVDDTDNLGRVQVTLQTKRIGPLADQITAVELRIQEGSDAGNTDKLKDTNGNDASVLIAGPTLNQIFKSGQPFTIKLSVDRASGRANAILTTGTKAISIDDAVLNLFNIDNATPLTVAGATLVNQEPNRAVSVEVTHFEIDVP